MDTEYFSSDCLHPGKAETLTSPHGWTLQQSQLGTEGLGVPGELQAFREADSTVREGWQQ